MKIRKTDKWIIIFVILAMISLNYTFLDDSLEKLLSTNKVVFIERVIDGDTVVANGTSIRLLGINTPEKGEFLYAEARNFLQNKTLRKNVTLDFTKDKKDKYGRTLAYLFLGNDAGNGLGNENVNAEIVEKGFANYYFYGGLDRYSNDLREAWNKCISNGINLCEPSINSCTHCISISAMKNSILNTCSFSCSIINWTIKTEGREKFVFNQSLNPGEKAGFVLDLSDSSGSLFLKDEKGKLVIWKP